MHPLPTQRVQCAGRPRLRRHAAALPCAAQEALRARIDGWLKEHGAKLAHQPPATHSDSEEDEEGDHPSYCGRAGCRDYPHEHVAWKEKKPAEKRQALLWQSEGSMRDKYVRMGSIRGGKKHAVWIK